jgi:ankyrin repeat protein
MMTSWAGHADLAELLLQSWANPDQQDNAGWTAMHHAVLRDQHKVVLSLLRFSANTAIVTNNGETCWNIACLTPSLLCMQVLPRSALQSDVEAISVFANEAIFTGAKTELKILVEKSHIDNSTKDIMGRTPVHMAILAGDIEVLEYLLPLGFSLESRDSFGRGALKYAAMCPKIKMARKILEMIPATHTHDDSWSPLHWACRTGKLEIIRLFLDLRFQTTAVLTSEPNHLWSPLDVAIYHGHSSILAHNDLQEALGPLSTALPQLYSTKRGRSIFVCDACENVSSYFFTPLRYHETLMMKKGNCWPTIPSQGRGFRLLLYVQSVQSRHTLL